MPILDLLTSVLQLATAGVGLYAAAALLRRRRTRAERPEDPSAPAALPLTQPPAEGR
ncbi:hypothetical protein [Nonomuraea endophytica]|uniref:Uncharacterized protein n=1 Tax=Nonomuraea endophytica TaxID=714136 RepID=A0A7W8ELH0_9ACTN|nr:hypothetical protein [Nonomuraea endophytica]MBB5085285.1 hypothetical protein [Nonomuraea endophytica]